MIVKMLEEYGFTTSDGLYYVRRRSKTVFLIVELKANQNGEVVYDFYKLTTYLQMPSKYYCQNDGEEFFINRFKKYFENYESWRRKKKLESMGFKSEREYRKSLEETRKKEVKRRKQDEIAHQQMSEANLKQVDKNEYLTRKGLGKVGESQMTMKL